MRFRSALRIASAALLVMMLLLTESAAVASAPEDRPTFADASWPHFHFDSANSGYNPFEHILNSTNVSHLHVAWSVKLSSVASPSPVVAAGTLFALDGSGTLWALKAARRPP